MFSLISSVIIFIPFAAIWQFTSIENLESQILHAHVIATYFCLSIVLGLGGGALVGVTNRKQVEVGSTWTNFAFSNVSDWVKVYTSDGKVYKGWIKQMSSHDSHKRELEIGEPKVLKEKQWAKAGESLFFTETNILRIKLLGSQEPKKD